MVISWAGYALWSLLLVANVTRFDWFTLAWEKAANMDGKVGVTHTPATFCTEMSGSGYG
ncbi:MAG TPA: hypothetical protein VMS00_01325 [Acidimicrobiales bacterium]|nr:hypothetical protein [Acidimicrobiales bacterium]